MQIDELFHSVLRREPSDRAEFLARACNGDTSLRVAVEALLAADDNASGFLEHRPEPSATVLELGRSVGAYRIVELIGRGGMGEVYRAHDARLSREVAIKVVPWSSTQRSRKPDWEKTSADWVGEAATLTFSPEPSTLRSDSGGEQVEQQDGDASSHVPIADDEVNGSVTQNLTLPGRLPLEGGAVLHELQARQESLRRRFESEALLTASVQHPAVVPIYEHGLLPDGRPFYSMKLVTGRSLRELIGERKTVGDRMALLPNLIAVAEALAHAHSRRILHRDVKPSNIIIGEFGETVLIDWGVAKNLSPERDSEPVRANDAPDRTTLGAIIGTPAYMSPEQAKGGSVDERADVFSLGATLYHLLAGRAPYEGDTARILPKIARGDYVPLSEQQPDVPGELAAIVNKAMAREVSQRYPTASELAEDLRRFQTGQLVLSHRYSARELLLRWARPHRAILIASAVFLIAAVAGGVVGVRRIVAERDRASREAEASQRVSDFMTQMFRVSNPSESRGNNITAREILDKAAKQIEGGLTQDPAVQARLMDIMAQVYDSLGLFAKAQPLAEKATELRQKVLGPEHLDTLRSMNNLAVIERHQGQYAGAEKLHRQVLDIRRRVLGRENPETLRSMNNLATVAREQGQYAVAEKVDREVLEIQRRMLGPEHPDTLRSMSNLAIDDGEQGNSASADELHREVLDIRRRTLGSDHPDTLRAMNNFAESERRMGRHSEAAKVYREVLDIRRRVLGPEHPDTLLSMSNVAGIEREQGHAAEAEKLDRLVLDNRRPVLGPEHPDTLRSMHNLAEDKSALGKQADAAKLHREVLDIQRRVLRPEHPDALQTTIALANVFAREGKFDESEKLQLEALAIRQRVFGPSNPHVAHSLFGLGKLALRQGDQPKALDYLRQAVDHGLTPGEVTAMNEDAELTPLRGNPELESLFAYAKKDAHAH